MTKKVVLAVVDGLGPELLDRAIAAGRAPTIARGAADTPRAARGRRHHPPPPAAPPAGPAARAPGGGRPHAGHGVAPRGGGAMDRAGDASGGEEGGREAEKIMVTTIEM